MYGRLNTPVELRTEVSVSPTLPSVDSNVKVTGWGVLAQPCSVIAPETVAVGVKRNPWVCPCEFRPMPAIWPELFMAYALTRDQPEPETIRSLRSRIPRTLS